MTAAARFPQSAERESDVDLLARVLSHRRASIDDQPVGDGGTGGDGANVPTGRAEGVFELLTLCQRSFRRIDFEVGTSENNRRARFYRLAAAGRRQLAVETSKWDRLACAIARILRPATAEGER
jgi:hypothetical protein